MDEWISFGLFNPYVQLKKSDRAEKVTWFMIGQCTR